MPVVLKKSSRWRVLAAHIGLIIFIGLTLFPFLMIISISLRPGNFAGGSLIPHSFSLEHWKLALGMSYADTDGNMVHPPFPVLLWIWNSIKVSLISATVSLVLSITSAYAFARMRFRGKGTLLNGLLLLQMFPSVLALVAIYALFDRIGDYVPWLGVDSHWSLALAYTGGVAQHIWLIKGYFDSVPYELEEAARVDGATPFQAFVYVLLPMALPILVVVFVLAFLGGMIEYPVASVLLHDEQKLTLAIGSRLFLFNQRYLWGDFAATAILAGIPLTLIFMITQRWLVSGLTAGSVKG
ncbi:maltose ABC transporter permease MalG [Amantichitinum ursilacus]|uniref:Maltose/maltodextrin transport system permease protein MalG n=1 Tax=Amantichitinum ursilacus TaxID=857265 RepID=A0A0N0XJ01_9NEIS|nr:maltose ABC transporter permease MalG [Amantichitinum ursilacus]KPC50639.1 Maltose transport system permease protein MalG [Amantichitinum ursilacus]